MFISVSTQPRSDHTAFAETTIFHRDGSRTVIGTSATVRYSPDGTATLIATAIPEPTDTLRWDLAA